MAIQGLWKLVHFDGDLRDFVFVMTNYELMLEALYMLKLLFKMQGCTCLHVHCVNAIILNKVNLDNTFT